MEPLLLLMVIKLSPDQTQLSGGLVHQGLLKIKEEMEIKKGEKKTRLEWIGILKRAFKYHRASTTEMERGGG